MSSRTYPARSNTQSHNFDPSPEAAALAHATLRSKHACERGTARLSDKNAPRSGSRLHSRPRLGRACSSCVGGRALTCGFGVDILAAYSNRADLLVDLRETARRLGWSAGADEADEPRSVRTLAPGFRTRQVVHRLGETALSEIVARFEEGTPKHRLAAEYEISLSTV